MEARARGNIDIQVRVVHPVKTPEYWHEVKQDMLTINGQIKQDDGERDFEPHWPRDVVEQSPPA